MKRSPQLAGLLTVLAVLAPLALAQETHVSHEGGAWIQVITGSLAGVKNLRIRADMGSVAVHGGAQQGINYVVHTRAYSSSEQEARRQFESYKVTAYVRGDTAWITGECQGGRWHKFSGDFVINIPREIGLVKIETDGGNVDATGVAGRVEAESGGGSMRLDDISGGATAETGGGSIDVGTVGGNVDLQTGGGSIAVRHANGKVKASSGGGSINLGDIGGPAEIETGGGSIHLASAQGHVEAQTGGGGIDLYGVPSARVETGSGGIVVKLIKTSAAPSDSMLETSAGDITVYIASDVAISVRASVDVGNGHRITSDFPDIHIASEGGQWGPRSFSAEGKLNGGGPVLKVRTTTGDIRFKRTNQ